MIDSTEVPAPSLLERLGPRAVRRMTPRAGIALAGAGALIAIGGAIGLGGDDLVVDDDVQRIKGVLVSAVVVAVGLFVLQRFRTGPLATAGATAAALGVPLFVFFATFDTEKFPPFSFDGVLAISAVVWLVAYFVVPTRGRVLFLALALVATPLFVMEQSEDVSQFPLAVGAGFSRAFMGTESDVESGVGSSDPRFSLDEDGNPIFELDEDGNPIFDGSTSDSTTSDFPEEPDFPDPTNLGVIALLFGAAYAAASMRLGRRGYAGTATPLAVVGAVLLFAGTMFVANDLEEVGTGILLILVGLALVYVGAASVRRFTTWFGALGFAIGVLVLVAKIVEGATTTVASLVLMAVGIGVVIGAHHATLRVAEPPEEDERPSFADGVPALRSAALPSAGGEGGDTDPDPPPHFYGDE